MKKLLLTHLPLFAIIPDGKSNFQRKNTMNRRHFLTLLSAALIAGCGKSDIVSNLSPGKPDDNALPFPHGESGKTLLRYQFKKGKELHWNVQHTLKMKNIIGGMEENIETRSRSVKIWKTLDIDPQGAGIFEYRVGDIDMHQAQTGYDDAIYNSRRDKAIPPAFMNIEGKIGIPLSHIRIDLQGNTKKTPLREYDGSISENRIVIPLHTEAVAVGSSWSELKQIELPLPNRTVKKIRMKEEFTLEKINSGLATIKFAKIILTLLSPKEETQLFEHYAVGSMDLDLDAGHFISQRSTIEKSVVGFQGTTDSVYYRSRLTECCCGRRACDICNG